MKINLPNQITLARLVLAIVFFALLSSIQPRGEHSTTLVLCFWIFLIAAMSDILDGYLARTLKQVTSFGRIVDPVVDKVMVCGAFVFFASPHFWLSGQNLTGVAPWMVVVILLRELLVSAIRSHSEAQGEAFAANWVGKLKMAVQSTTVCVVLGQLGWGLSSIAWLRTTCVWATVVVTSLSTIAYIGRAYRFLLASSALQNDNGAASRGAAASGSAPAAGGRTTA